MKTISFCAFLTSSLVLPAIAGEPHELTADMLTVIEGDDWTGSLTYLNYQEPFEDVTIPANVEITLIERGVELAYKYPNEPHANSRTRAKISAEGTKFMGAPIVSNDISADGSRAVITRYPCQDMGRSASCEMTYSLSADRLMIQKMVTYDGETNAFQRNAYMFER